MVVERMKASFKAMLWIFLFLFAMSPAAVAGEYAALEGVDGVKAVFEVSHGTPKSANIIFEAIRQVYTDKSVTALSEKTKLVIVFHGPAVKLISSDLSLFSAEESEEVKKFQKTLRMLKKDGVVMEICLYAADVVGVDKATIMTEIDRVGNGFISVIGYQHRGYAVVRVP